MNKAFCRVEAANVFAEYFATPLANEDPDTMLPLNLDERACKVEDCTATVCVEENKVKICGGACVKNCIPFDPPSPHSTGG